MTDRDREFRNYLREAIRRLNAHETSEQEDSLARPRFDDPGVQKRMASQISRVARENGQTR